MILAGMLLVHKRWKRPITTSLLANLFHFGLYNTNTYVKPQMIKWSVENCEENHHAQGKTTNQKQKAWLMRWQSKFAGNYQAYPSSLVLTCNFGLEYWSFAENMEHYMEYTRKN